MKLSNGNWKEVINGHDNEFFLRFNVGNIADIIGKGDNLSDDARNDFIEINLDHIKMIQYKISSNNKYETTAANPSLVGGTLGNQIVSGRVVTRNGKESVLTEVKKMIFEEGLPKIMRNSVGDKYATGLGADQIGGTVSNDEYGPGFSNELEDSDLTADSILVQTVIEAISYSQLPTFDIIALSKTKTGKKIKARLVINGIKFTANGNSMGVDALEMNSVLTFMAKGATGWKEVK